MNDHTEADRERKKERKGKRRGKKEEKRVRGRERKGSLGREAAPRNGATRRGGSREEKRPRREIGDPKAREEIPWHGRRAAARYQEDGRYRTCALYHEGKTKVAATIMDYRK
ncbi:PREDICTED: uncharacterized protein LOC108755239 [Trachymyrmex septentrionalis]|uniref:uncharacterized protein LOC108755239 n=1 Tax=Trachymyrmex septentrionalis TaxID=34720 RepID=UPI00084F1F02|nr:PREDICTED: uncharacterized protein LOC108755239 [Trachymyrmex septentrionalis]